RVSIAETVALLIFVTYTRVPSGVMARSVGRSSPLTSPIGLLVLVSITDTVPSSRLAAYHWRPSGDTATPNGWVPTGIEATIVLVLASMTKTRSEILSATYTRCCDSAGLVIAINKRVQLIPLMSTRSQGSRAFMAFALPSESIVVRDASNE